MTHQHTLARHTNQCHLETHVAEQAGVHAAVLLLATTLRKPLTSRITAFYTETVHGYGIVEFLCSCAKTPHAIPVKAGSCSWSRVIPHRVLTAVSIWGTSRWWIRLPLRKQWPFSSRPCGSVIKNLRYAVQWNFACNVAQIRANQQRSSRSCIDLTSWLGMHHSACVTVTTKPWRPFIHLF